MNRRKLSNFARMQIAAAKSWRCYICNSVLDASFEIDHVISLAHGGKDLFENLSAICRNCHIIKSKLEVAALYNSHNTMYCHRCDISFSKYFIQKHIH